MNMNLLYAGSALAAVAFVAWLLVMRANRRGTADGGRADAYHCVSITFPDCACDAVKSIRTYRFLSHEAPLLPLPKCTAPECKCRYAHFPDRREDLRRNPYGLRRSVPPATIAFDRRFVNDRRARATQR